jgi:hypothetical protein
MAPRQAKPLITAASLGTTIVFITVSMTRGLAMKGRACCHHEFNEGLKKQVST